MVKTTAASIKVSQTIRAMQVLTQPLRMWMSPGEKRTLTMALPFRQQTMIQIRPIQTLWQYYYGWLILSYFNEYFLERERVLYW